MAVEIVGFEMVQGPTENGVEGGKPDALENENGKVEKDLGAGETIKFGSHGDESAKGEVNDVADSNTPNNAAEEWPAPKQIHSFWFVRFRPYDDPAIKAKIDVLDKEISKKNEARFKITEALKAKRSERSELISQVKVLRGDHKQYQNIFDEKMKEIEPLQQALGKLRNTNNAGRGGLCSSEEELNDVIYSLQYRIQHESIPLTEEKQILREIKQLEGTRDKVIANAAMRTKLQDTMGQKNDIQDQVKLIGGDLDGVKKERQALRSKIKQIDDAIEAINTDIQTLQEELTTVTQKREQAFESIQKLRKQRDEGNSHFYQSRALLTKARELAAKKDVNALDELNQTEENKFKSLWNGGKAFRDDYEKRILSSLDMRQMSRDGRIRNPDEKPLLAEPKPAESEALPKAIAKQPKEEPKASPVETLSTQKETKTKGRDLKTKSDNKDLAATDDDYEFENPHKDISAVKEPEIDPAKLKEIKREEEIAKAKLAAERKKKLAEKAAAKAALKAQKEAEKKLKDREKKAKKKSGAVNTPQEEQEAAEAEATEPEKVNDVVEALAPVKEKVTRESSVRSRIRGKVPEPIPKAILKRKKSNNYWIWIPNSHNTGSHQNVVVDGKVRKATDSKHGSQVVSGPTTPLPDKKLLLFILDRLQKKDTHGVFSEPVDPEELPDYHDIIKDPMDFGTIRKKIDGDGGFYISLEQFENDVFLVCSNAMQYNSPDTIYHRQARAMQEIARKDFENLRQDSEDDDDDDDNDSEPPPPPKIVQRGRPPGKHKKKSLGMSPVEHAAPESSSDATLASGGDIASGSNGYNLRKVVSKFQPSDSSTRALQYNSGGYTNWTSEWENEFPASVLKAVSRYGKKQFTVDETRRDTYRNPVAVGNETPVLTAFEDNFKQLLAVGLHVKHSYARSLAHFAADLGPVAWKVAARKISSVLPPGHEFGPGWVSDDDVSQKQHFAVRDERNSDPPVPEDYRSRFPSPSRTFSLANTSCLQSGDTVINRDPSYQNEMNPGSSVSGGNESMIHGRIQQEPAAHSDDFGSSGRLRSNFSPQMTMVRLSDITGSSNAGNAPQMVDMDTINSLSSQIAPTNINPAGLKAQFFNKSSHSDSSNLSAPESGFDPQRFSQGLAGKSSWQGLEVPTKQNSFSPGNDLNALMGAATNSHSSNVETGPQLQPNLALQL